jgi:hypothetical protein
MRRRLDFVTVDYILGGRHIAYEIIHENCVLFLAVEQHVGRIRFGILA